MNTNLVSALGNAELIHSARTLLKHSHVIEADLLVLLGEVEERRLHLERAFPSMFAFCTEELGMSEGVAFNRISAARLVRRLPCVLDWVLSGRVHLSGLRLLVPHLTEANCTELLAEASGKSKRDIEVLVTRFAPKPPVPTTIRKLPTKSAAAPVSSVTVPPTESTPAPLVASGPELLLTAPTPSRPRLEPLTPDTFAMTLTIDRALRAKVKQAQDLMRHRVPNGDVGAILEEALDVLIEKVKKERFGVGRRKPRPVAADPIPGEGDEGSPHVTRHVPEEARRAVYERDQGRCTYESPDGRRCAETGGLELDHLDGFAITRDHDVARISLRCRPHNQHAAEKTYGHAKMARMKNSLSVTRPGASEQEWLF